MDGAGGSWGWEVTHRIDAAILAFVQDWIADPLQWGGVELDWQVLAACLVSCIGTVLWACRDVLERRWFSLGIDGLIVPVYLAYVVYGISGIHKSEIATLQPMWPVVFAVGTVVFVIVDSINGWDLGSAGGDLFSAGVALRLYLVRCKPKPPAPLGKAVEA